MGLQPAVQLASAAWLAAAGRLASRPVMAARAGRWEFWKPTPHGGQRGGSFHITANSLHITFDGRPVVSSPGSRSGLGAGTITKWSSAIRPSPASTLS